MNWGTQQGQGRHRSLGRSQIPRKTRILEESTDSKEDPNPWGEHRFQGRPEFLGRAWFLRARGTHSCLRLPSVPPGMSGDRWAVLPICPPLHRAISLTSLASAHPEQGPEQTPLGVLSLSTRAFHSTINDQTAPLTQLPLIEWSLKSHLYSSCPLSE